MTITPNPWIAALAQQVLGDYVLGKDLGSGSFGVVFEAINQATGARFAVKVLVPGSQSEAQLDFDNEGLLLEQLGPCAGVINFVEAATSQIMFTSPVGTPVPVEVRYIVMAQASGSLDELTEDPAIRSNLDWGERLRLWRSMVKALMQLHLHNVAHRDLKCSNCLMLVSRNVPTQIRFADLGRARDLSASAAHSPDVYLRGRGDFRFAPPEALFWQGGDGRDDFLSADYYGLGSLLVELVTGHSMTAAAIGDYRSAQQIGLDDYRNGRRRDLSALNLHFRQVIGEVVEQMPSSIRADALVVLASLCHPDPAKRLLESPFSRDRESRDKLAWILRRADIMIRRLEIEIRDERRRQKTSA